MGAVGLRSLSYPHEGFVRTSDRNVAWSPENGLVDTVAQIQQD